MGRENTLFLLVSLLGQIVPVGAIMPHLETYPLIQERMKSNRLRLHGWWFDIGSGNVYSFDESTKRFALIDG